MVVQKLEQEITLLLLESHDSPGELRIHEECFLACHGVRAHNGVHVRDGLAADDAAASQGCSCLLVARVHGFEAVETLLEGWRETLVGFGHVAEEGVAAGGGAVEDVEEGCAWGLDFWRGWKNVT